MAEATETLLDRIIDLEWEMTRSAQTGRPAANPEDEGAFRLLRWMTHSVLPGDLLARMHSHLAQAKAEGRNLVAEKHARLGARVPAPGGAPVIARLVALEQAWMDEVQRRYPFTFPGQGDGFQAHLAADLETLPADYLDALCAFEAASREAGRNLIAERYEKLFQRLGFASIEEHEHQALLDSRRCGGGNCC